MVGLGRKPENDGPLRGQKFTHKGEVHIFQVEIHFILKHTYKLNFFASIRPKNMDLYVKIWADGRSAGFAKYALTLCTVRV